MGGVYTKTYIQHFPIDIGEEVELVFMYYWRDAET